MIGFYNVIKPTGVSSAYVVNKIKHATTQKVGHLGTLDPLASGVLPVAVGKATKLFDYFLKKDKRYIALMKVGFSTDTLDSEGKVVALSNRKVTLDEVRSASKKLIGEIMQIPPKYSAKSVNGIRAYDAAVKDIEIKLEPKKTQIYSINVEKWHQNNVFRLDIECSAGTYVRSIVRDIAQILDVEATTVAIIRIKSGNFEITNGATLSEIIINPNKYLIRLNDILKLEELIIDDAEAKALAEGKSIDKKLGDGFYLTLYNGEEFSMAKVCDCKLKNVIYFYDGGTR